MTMSNGEFHREVNVDSNVTMEPLAGSLSPPATTALTAGAQHLRVPPPWVTVISIISDTTCAAMTTETTTAPLLYAEENPPNGPPATTLTIIIPSSTMWIPS
nr:unnamed protein product [Spirometra erinaceieuropaei]